MRYSLPTAVVAYIWATGTAAFALSLYWAYTWRGPDTTTIEQALLAAVLILLAAVAVHFPLEVAQGYNVNLVTAVQFAALLLFGPPVAMLLVATGALVGLVALRVRLALTKSSHFRSWKNILFNASQLTIGTGLAGVVYYTFLPHDVPAPRDRPENLLAVPLAAAVMWITSSGLVATIAGLQRGLNPLDVLRSTRRREILHEAGLFLLGFVTARTAQNDPWIPLVMVLPAWIIYLSTKRNVQLVTQTIEAVEALADLVDRRDPYTFQHSKRVADFSQRIAKAMGLPSDQVEQIRLAARVHDLGKIGVPNDVLHKQGELTPAEWKMMRNHPAMGHEILAKFPEYKEGRELVLAHHEHFDGQGYPNGLTGGRLRLGAQIISVADTLDAMTSDRPYRKALPLEVALAELRKGRGSQFNPDVVEALERLLDGDTSGGRRAVSRETRPIGPPPSTAIGASPA